MKVQEISDISNTGRLTTCVTYQGGKVRLAPKIVSAIGLPYKGNFYDLCCGSGAVTVEAVARGQDPKTITMVDLSPWGKFWEFIGNGAFCLDTFRQLCASVPTDIRRVKSFITSLYQRPVGDDFVYVFLLLQASTVGGTAVWIEGKKWRKGGGFRDYWEPTTTSSRRSPVNPMMPMPTTIYERVVLLSQKMRGVIGMCADIIDVAKTIESGRVYIDPPYNGTTPYGHAIDVVSLARSMSTPCWVSEACALSDNALLLSSGRAKGGITGDRKRTPQEEWLSFFGHKNYRRE